MAQRRRRCEDRTGSDVDDIDCCPKAKRQRVTNIASSSSDHWDSGCSQGRNLPTRTCRRKTNYFLLNKYGKNYCDNNLSCDSVQAAISTHSQIKKPLRTNIGDGAHCQQAITGITHNSGNNPNQKMNNEASAYCQPHSACCRIPHTQVLFDGTTASVHFQPSHLDLPQWVISPSHFKDHLNEVLARSNQITVTQAANNTFPVASHQSNRNTSRSNIYCDPNDRHGNSQIAVMETPTTSTQYKTTHHSIKSHIGKISLLSDDQNPEDAQTARPYRERHNLNRVMSRNCEQTQGRQHVAPTNGNTDGHHNNKRTRGDTTNRQRVGVYNSASSSASAASSNVELSVSVASNLYECDEKGHIKFVAGLMIGSRHKYKVLDSLGKGTFSRVFKCVSNDCANSGFANRQTFAVKVIRNVFKYQRAAKTELDVLQRIKSNDPYNISCCIHYVDQDNYRGHPLLIFPLYGKSIYNFMVQSGYKAFNELDCIAITRQICTAVAYLHSINIIITDLKPENVVLVNDAVDTRYSHLYSCPIYKQIKLIDFGCAVIHDAISNPVHNHLIQTRHYRAPEVVFKLNWSFSADVWSIGCIVVELLHGHMLFNTHDNIDHLNQMVKCIGSPPSYLLEQIDDETWNDYFDDRGVLNMDKARISSVQCARLDVYFRHRCFTVLWQKLHDLCQRMLCWCPAQRISAQQALTHPAFRLLV